MTNGQKVAEADIKTIQTIKRANSSVNGNPAFKFTFTDGTEARSSSDASFCYEVGNPDMREGSTVYVEWTRSGRIAVMWTEGQWARQKVRRGIA